MNIMQPSKYRDSLHIAAREYRCCHSLLSRDYRANEPFQVSVARGSECSAHRRFNLVQGLLSSTVPSSFLFLWDTAFALLAPVSL